MTLPPEPDISPNMQTMQWVSRPYSFLEECEESLGTPFTLDLKNHGKYVLFSDPKAIGDILSAPEDVLVASKGNRILRPLLGSRSLLLIDGAHHRRLRRLILPAFHRKKVARFGKSIQEITTQELNHWPLHQSFSMREAMQRVSLKIILKVLFGLESGRSFEALTDAFDEILSNDRFNLALIGRLDDDGRTEQSKLGRDFRAALQRACGLVDEEIDRRRKQANTPPNGVLDLLLCSTDEDGEHLDDEEIRDQLVTLIATGHETTATALAWAVYWILSTPNVLTQFRKSLDSLGPNPTTGAVAKLAYLDAICKETLRIYPIVPIIARWVARPYEIQGITIEAGVTVSPAIYLTHHRPEIYESPDQFQPARFMEHNYSATEYLPFGGARRRCIGSNLAIYEMKLILAAIFESVELQLVGSAPVRPVRKLVTISPADGTRVQVVRRLC